MMCAALLRFAAAGAAGAAPQPPALPFPWPGWGHISTSTWGTPSHHHTTLKNVSFLVAASTSFCFTFLLHLLQPSEPVGPRSCMPRVRLELVVLCELRLRQSQLLLRPRRAGGGGLTRGPCCHYASLRLLCVIWNMNRIY
jgi:hypothetical protein